MLSRGYCECEKSAVPFVCEAYGALACGSESAVVHATMCCGLGGDGSAWSAVLLKSLWSMGCEGQMRACCDRASGSASTGDWIAMALLGISAVALLNCGAPPACERNAVRSCECDPLRVGHQRCEDDGTAWQGCLCSLKRYAPCALSGAEGLCSTGACVAVVGAAAGRGVCSNLFCAGDAGGCPVPAAADSRLVGVCRPTGAGDGRSACFLGCVIGGSSCPYGLGCLVQSDGLGLCGPAS